MTSPEPLVFEPSARLQRLLSRELISDPNLAVIELVKNGYDAGATEVSVELEADGKTPRLHVLTIADNGSGMTESEFRDNWMRPGYSEKARNPGAAFKVKGKSRTPVGEKGLGRLAAGRLGERLTVYTRKRQSDPWFKLEVDWERFDDMDSAMNSIKLPSSSLDQAPSAAYSKGTLLVIEQMTVDLTGNIPGRKVAGRSGNRFGRLSQDLRLLTTSASGASSSDFSILLNVDVKSLEEYTGAFEAVDSLIEGQFLFKFHVWADKSAETQISREILRGDSKAGEAVELIVNEAGLLNEVRTVSRAPHNPQLECGEFSGTLSYAPPIRGQSTSAIVPAGVFLYRDGVRVEPYGEPEADWIGAYSRKASRQGYAPIQPKHLYGAVLIARKTNPELTDTSNRQGLIENESFFDLINHVRAEFAYFEEIVQEHRQTPRWEQSQAKKRQAAAQQRVETSRVQSRALAHAVRQPLTGLDAELFILSEVIRDTRLPDDLRSRLVDLESRLRRHATDISERVQTFLHAGDEKVEDFALRDVLNEVHSRVEPLADARDAEILFDDTDLHLSFARGVLVEALVELVTNGIAAPDVGDRTRTVAINVQDDRTRLTIGVADNGGGLPAQRAKDPFEVGMSNSGRPGHGLVSQKLNLVGAGGDVRLVRSTADGTEFEVVLPLSSALLDLGRDD